MMSEHNNVGESICVPWPFVFYTFEAYAFVVASITEMQTGEC